MTTQADIIRKEPWFVTPAIRNWYFEKYTKLRSEAVSGALLFDGDDENNDRNFLWTQFQKHPSRFPVYTAKQFNQLIKNRELTEKDKRNIARVLKKNPKAALCAKSGLINLEGKVDLSGKITTVIDTFVSNIKNILAIDAKEIHQYIAANYWDKINPANAFWARLFSRFEWMQKRIEKEQEKLSNVSIYYRAKITGKTVEELQRGDGVFDHLDESEGSEEDFGVYKAYPTTKNDKSDEMNSELEEEESENLSLKKQSDNEKEQVIKVVEKEKEEEKEEEQDLSRSSSYTSLFELEVDNDNNNNVVITYPETKSIPWGPEHISLTEHAKKTLPKDNNDPKVQFARDVDYLQKAIQKPGSEEHHGPLAASILKKLSLTFDVLDPMYKRDGKWCRFSDTDIPLASILSHTGRVLIQLPPKRGEEDIGAEFFEEFLGLTKKHKRGAATHGIMLRPSNEKTCDGIVKSVTETKPGKLESGKDYLVNQVREKLVGQTRTGHYGVNLALGGNGNEHFLSQKTINNKGENGHLYFYYLPAREGHPGAVLVGIEQSAPADKAAADVQDFLGSVYDNVGGGHDILGTPNNFSSTGGDHWGRAQKKKIVGSDDYEGLKNHGPDQYYDGLFSSLTKEQLAYIKANYKDDEFDLSMLSRPATANKLKEDGHQALSESLQKQKIELNEDEEGLWDYFTKIVWSKDDKIDMDKHRKQVLELVSDKLTSYLDQEGKTESNRKIIDDLAKKISQVQSWDDLYRVIEHIEQITINNQNEKQTVDQMLNKDELLPEDLKNKDEGNDLIVQEALAGKEVQQTVLGYFQQRYEYIIPAVHSKDAILDTHKALVGLVKQNQAYEVENKKSNNDFMITADLSGGSSSKKH